jgi:hypothetical protein
MRGVLIVKDASKGLDESGARARHWCVSYVVFYTVVVAGINNQFPPPPELVPHSHVPANISIIRNGQSVKPFVQHTHRTWRPL